MSKAIWYGVVRGKAITVQRNEAQVSLYGTVAHWVDGKQVAIVDAPNLAAYGALIDGWAENVGPLLIDALPERRMGIRIPHEPMNPYPQPKPEPECILRALSKRGAKPEPYKVGDSMMMAF